MKKHSNYIIGGAAILLILGIIFWGIESSAPKRPSITVIAAQTPATGIHAQSTAPIKDTPVPLTKYASLPFVERNAFLEKVKKLDLPAIFQVWLNADRVDHDLLEQNDVATALGVALRKQTPSPEFLHQLRQYISSDSNPNLDRELLIGALGLAGTKDSLDLLLHAATTLSDDTLVQGAIMEIGSFSSSGKTEGLSPLLEKAWLQATNRRLLLGVGMAMARLGTSGDIDTLLGAALDDSGADNMRKMVAQRALLEVYQGSAVSTLTTHLKGQTPMSETGKLVSTTLVRIGNATSAAAVVKWLRETSEDATPLIHDLFQATRTPQMYEAWSAALNPAISFKNKGNQEAIRLGLVRHKAGMRT